MRITLAFLCCLAVAVACSSGGNTSDASGGGGATGTAGSTGAGGTNYAKCNGVPDECCDLPEAASICRPTLEAQLANTPTVCALGTPMSTDKTCGDYRFVSVAGCLPSWTCVYDEVGQLTAWKTCGDSTAPCGDPCQHGGRHADGGVTTFFTAAAPPCPAAP